MKKAILTSLVLAAGLQYIPQMASAAGTTPNKDSANYYVRLATEERTARRYANAWKYYEKASGYDATNAEIQKSIADVCLQMNRMAPALKALEAYSAMRPSDDAAYLQLAKMYFNFGQWEKVIDMMPKAHQRMPNEQGWAYMLGKAYFSTQNYGKGIDYLEQAVKADPNNADALYLIGHMYTLMSNYNQSLPYYRRSLAIDSVTSNNVRLYEFALVLSTASKFEESISVFEKALEKGYKARDDFYMNLAYTLADAHQTGRAVKMLDDMLVRRPNDIGILEALADVCYHSGRYDQAITYWDKLLAMDDHNARALYQIGLAYIKLGKNTDGQQLCDKAIAMDPALAQLRHQKNGMM